MGKSDHILMEFDNIRTVSLVESVSVKYQYEFGNYQEFCAELESILVGITCLLNCLLITSGHVFNLDLRFCWINTFQCLPLFQVIPNHHAWLTKLVLKKIKQKRKSWIKY